MKFMIASDIHGSATYCELLLERFEREGADRLILLGDLLYHGARNPLPEGYSTLECARLLNGVKENILAVRGNCDSEVDEMVLEFPIDAKFAFLPYGNRVLYFTHGHKKPACLKKDDVLFCGHFHVPAFEKREEGYFYVNCGSVGIPKENSPHSALLYEEGQLCWLDLETGGIYRYETL